jgi:hypothetical protein
MKKTSLFFCICVFSLSLKGQINRELKSKLDSIQSLDQTIRSEVANLLSNQNHLDSLSQITGTVMSDYVKNLMLKQESIDKMNLTFIDSIIKIIGYPGKSLVGETTCNVAWFIIQHSDKIDQYYTTLRKAANKGDIPDSLFAKTQDRILLKQGKKQKFGTQAECLPNDKGTFDCVIFPIRNAKNVNKRRKKAGFNTSIEEYAERNSYLLNN